MKVYTSYFGNARKFPRTMAQVAICAKLPSYFSGPQYKPIAPTYEILTKYKQDGDQKSYVEKYEKDVLSKLNPHEVFDDIVRISGVGGALSLKQDIVLLCYEAPNDFCHRHLVAKWLNENGYNIKEL